MCDTMGKIGNKNRYSIFAKNSDRERDEPQVMVFIEAKTHSEKTMKATYIEIDQVEHTNAVLLSKPVWMWGAEMGVNEYGVCIGNEAIATTTCKNNPVALIGMDLVRLGLERAKSAREAVDVIVDLLLKYGQGGNCGYNKETYYDNAFLIMDKDEIYVMEAVGKNYAISKKQCASISNCLTITNADEYSDVKNFKKKYYDIVKRNSEIRQKTTFKNVLKAETKEDYFDILRIHATMPKRSICQHGEYESTNSMVVVLEDKPVVYFTGCANPCCHEYLKYTFNEELIYPINTEENQDDCEFWKKQRLAQEG